jgi:hypothetical protein
MTRGWKLTALATALLLGGVAAARAQAQVSPVQRLASYPGAVGKPIEDKLSFGSPELLDRTLKSNLEYGQDVRPISASPDNPLVPQVRAMLKALPPDIHRLASRYVVALFLLEEDYGTGVTEGVQDEQGRWRYTYMALNLTALTRTANAWAEWKENSAFRPAPGFRVKMTLEAPAGDTLENALRFIFLHELGHAVALAQGIHGFWDDEGLPAATRDSPYVRISWQPALDRSRMDSRWSGRFPRLAQIKFYSFAKAPLLLSDAEAVYRALAQTDFPSLYGASNLYDDFAEAFAIYVHTKLQGRPYEVEVLEGDQSRLRYSSCIVTGGCPEKVKAVEAALAAK